MNANKKKKVIVIGSLLVIGGVVGYILWKRKKDQENALTNTTPAVEEIKVEETKVVEEKKPIVVKGTQPVITQSLPPTKPTPLPPKFVSKSKVNATDVLASNIKGGNARPLYAISGGFTIYNAGGVPTAKTVKGQRLGTIINAQPTSKGYWINYVGAGNVRYKIMAIPNTYLIEI